MNGVFSFERFTHTHTYTQTAVFTSSSKKVGYTSPPPFQECSEVLSMRPELP